MKPRIKRSWFLPAIIRDMPRIVSEITHAYPSLVAALSAVSADEEADTRLMSGLASHVVDLFEAGQREEARPAFDLAEHLIAFGDEEESHAAVVGLSGDGSERGFSSTMRYGGFRAFSWAEL